jgi:hypothetical protein
MAYTLKVNEGSSPTAVENPTPEQIEEAVDTLIPVRYHWVVLETDEPIDCCDYVQVAFSLKSPEVLNYQLEVHFTDGDPWRQYQLLTPDAGFVKRTLRMFALGINPKLDDSWRDIVQEILDEQEEDKGKETDKEGEDEADN